MDNHLPLVKRIIVPHAAYDAVNQQLDQLYHFAQLGSAGEGLAILGESRTGKSTLLEQFEEKHPAVRNQNGMHIEALRVSVPVAPTTRMLASEMLFAFHAPDWDQGNVRQMTRRLTVLIEKCGTRIVIIDEFNHFYDRGRNKIMFNVADWLKQLIEETHTTLVISGLPTCEMIISSNEQLAGRFLAPIHLPRFDWSDSYMREQFKGIISTFHQSLASLYQIPAFSEDMAFRFYCATGGLIGYVGNLLSQAERNAIYRHQDSISLADLHTAHMEAVWKKEVIIGLPLPFLPDFAFGEVDASLVRRIGTRTEDDTPVNRRRRGPVQLQTLSSVLVAS